MELAAVVVIPTKKDLPAEMGLRALASTGTVEAQDSCFSGTPILGNDLLSSWMESIRKAGVASIWLGADRGEDTEVLDLSHFATQGVERLLMIRLESYAEMDLIDFLRFHRESQNSITDAQDARGHLGVSLLDRATIFKSNPERGSCDPLSPPVCGRTPYEFRGYAKRVVSAKERQELVRDALLGTCAMRPAGTQIRGQAWIGEGASLADSARIIGPAYIGQRTVVRSGATIGPFSSLENDCVVDCGTTVEDATVLPHTYVAPGLLIRRAQVDGGFLEDLGSGTIADLTPAALGSRIELLRQSDRRDGRPVRAPVFKSGEDVVHCSRSISSRVAHPWIQVQL